MVHASVNCELDVLPSPKHYLDLITSSKEKNSWNGNTGAIAERMLCQFAKRPNGQGLGQHHALFET